MKLPEGYKLNLVSRSIRRRKTMQLTVPGFYNHIYVFGPTNKGYRFLWLETVLYAKDIPTVCAMIEALRAMED